MMRRTGTARYVTAGCFDCSGSDPRWEGPNAQGVAARHHDATRHATWCEVHMSITYGTEAPDPRQIDIEDRIAITRSGDRPEAVPLPVPDAPAVTAASVSAPEGRSSRSALAAAKPEVHAP